MKNRQRPGCAKVWLSRWGAWALSGRLWEFFKECVCLCVSVFVCVVCVYAVRNLQTVCGWFCPYRFRFLGLRKNYKVNEKGWLWLWTQQDVSVWPHGEALEHKLHHRVSPILYPPSSVSDHGSGVGWVVGASLAGIGQEHSSGEGALLDMHSGRWTGAQTTTLAQSANYICCRKLSYNRTSGFPMNISGPSPEVWKCNLPVYIWLGKSWSLDNQLTILYW